MELDLQVPDHAYLYGFLLGDGTLRRGPGAKGSLSVEVNERDAALVGALQALLPGSSLHRRTRRTNFAASSSTVVLRSSRFAVREAFRRAGFPEGRKSTVVAPPPGRHDERCFARGFVAADGSLGLTATSRPFVSLVTASPAMADWWCRLVGERTGVPRTWTPNTRDGVANVVAFDESAQVLAAWLYRPDDLALPRKAAKAVEVAAWVRPSDRARRGATRRWTPQEDAAVLAHDGPLDALADGLARSVTAVSLRRWRLTSGGAR